MAKKQGSAPKKDGSTRASPAPPDAFSQATAPVKSVSELRDIYAEFLRKKDEEIEALRRENSILLRTAIKRRDDELVR